MRTPLTIFAFGLALAASALGQAAVEPLLQSGEDTLGNRLSYPATDAPEITGAIVTMAPGSSTGWHSHAMPTFAYLRQPHAIV